ncbi:SusC/RagA family TonB-linked outer membrane protein [Pedobacter sp. SD-b]|uniref:SusC/RagA family TonB-linked outer membrane protein n=1 Tax=Pedobacter segetis TaxID=2793069 RepID=A0ABS1BFZ1_9SPHI|nr:SusC/RagA family TonB-linked outer membrane protein [Pedobacter segetis]MBK0381779.1 SusC/RagA family TonB-linked outer membrane protein [Pedobacter segetis]
MRKSYMLKHGLFLLMFLLAIKVFGQSGSITGKVVDENNLPLPGASVKISQTKATSTDVNGNYRFTDVNGQVTVTVSFIGYQDLSQQVLVNGSTVLNFKLKPSSTLLNELVVIGYGTTERKNVTGSVATVNAKDFRKGTISSPEQLIQGKVAGVAITQNSGQPGGASTIRIRGGASLNASNDPLIVVDGVPLSGNSIGNAPGPLSLINPNDIETFTILKDANATAIYGSRASNGVILITTKKGSSGKPMVNVSTNNSVATANNTINVLSPSQIRDYVNANPTATYGKDNNGKDLLFTDLVGNANTDWQNVIYRTALTTDNNVSISGTTKKVPYRVSVGYLDQQGLLQTDKFNRTSAAIGLSPKFFDNHLKVDLNLKGALTKSHFANADGIQTAIQFDPTQPVRTTNDFGNYYEWLRSDGTVNPNAPRNPLGLIDLKDNNGKANRSFGNLALDYSLPFLPELHANLNVGYDVSKGTGNIFVPTFAAQSIGTQGSISQSKNTENNKFSEFYLSYNKDLKSINSNINATAGYGYYDNSKTTDFYTSFKGTGEVLTEPKFPFSTDRDKLLSYYGRVVYTLDNKYIVSGTMRADASSKFSPNNRWGYFPSVGFTWRAINESFLKNSKTLSDLKLRLSYGQTGNKDGIGYTDYLSKYYANSNTGQYNVGGTYYDYYSPAGYDPDLRWETTTTYNTGLDYGFLKGRLYGSVDAYYKKTKDLLSTVNIPVGTNFSNLLTTNVGNMDVRGLETSINFKAIAKEKQNWDLGLNFAFNKRKVTNLTLNPDPGSKVSAGDIAGGTGITLKYNAVNQIPGSFFVYKQVYDSAGKPVEGLYADLNKDGVINTNDQYFYKSPDPTFTLGFNTAYTYNKWTISTSLRTYLGNYIYDNVSSNFGVRSNILSPAGVINNASVDFLKTNFKTNQYLSDYYIKNASFLKMDNLGLSYDFGNLGKNTGNFRVSANCQNVFTVSKYKGLDPENNTGIDYNLYPRPRTFTLGLNLGF